MTETTQPRATSRLSPAALVGAGVLIASVAGAAGWMARPHAPATEPAPQQLALAPNEAVVPAAPVPQALAPSAATAAAPVVESPAVKPAPAAPAHTTHGSTHTPTKHAATPAPAPVTSSTTPLETQKAAVCNTCGVIEGVRAVEQKGEGTGLGAVGGAVLGGVLGHQVGGGKGKSAMTVLGAVGGGLAGHEVEKRARSTTVYEVHVRMDDGSVRTFTEKTQPTPGARVVVEGNSFHTVSANGGTGV